MNPYGDPTYAAYAQQPYASTSTAPADVPPPPLGYAPRPPPPPPDAPPSSASYGGTPLMSATAGDPGLPPLLLPTYGSTDDTGTVTPAVVHPLNPLKGDWTTRIDLATTNQLPPGGTIILPSGNAIPKQLAGGTELVKVTGKVRAHQGHHTHCSWLTSYLVQSCANCRMRKVKVSLHGG